MYTTSFLLAIGLASQGAVATGWGSGKTFSCPGNTPATCSSEQSSGFSWGSVSVGSSVSSFGGCGFSGVTCQAQGPGGKLHKRTGAQDKCVSGPIHGSASSCPKMTAGQGSGAGQTFNPTSYSVSCSYDTQVDFTYEMQDGSTCKHTSPCQAGGNTVQNTQCGGAKSVTCSQSEGEKSKNNGKECSMGIHSIGFGCGPATSITPPKSSSTPVALPPSSTLIHSSEVHSTAVSSAHSTEVHSTQVQSTEIHSTAGSTAPVTSQPASSTPSSSAPGSTKPATTPVPSSSAPGMPPYQPPTNTTSKPGESSPPGSTTPVASSVPMTSAVTTTFQTISTVFQTTVRTITSCGPEVTNCPARSTGVLPTPIVVTDTISAFTTVCPVTATLVPSSGSMVPVVSSVPVSSAPGQTTPVATSKPAESSSAAGSSAPAPSSSGVPLNCPDVVPSCINTLLQSVQTTCQNNADSSCFCAVGNHTQFIQECITAHGADSAEISSALSYLQGLCAPQIPQNPSIVTHQPNGQPQQPQCPSGVPATTVTVQYTTTVPCSQGAAAPPATSAPAQTTPVATSVPITSSASASAPAAPPASQSMTVITTQSVVTVPQVQVTAPPAASGATSAPAPQLVPGYGTTTAQPATQGPPATQPATPAQPAATTPVATSKPFAPVYGGATTAAASTGGVKPTGSISPPIATGAAGKMGVSFGAVAVAAALLL